MSAFGDDISMTSADCTVVRNEIIHIISFFSQTKNRLVDFNPLICREPGSNTGTVSDYKSVSGSEL